ncbi:M20/M25/M40 family metallo-hydrolase [Terriglobus albidus]|uniref:M20/M25/M40 family metallo-hydrolase n=1 Tax=Terriglobus albidus TaxID=1592106 RepID=UPI0021E0BF22|nr:M20/M25/M40 family metallo-hydrolase [Terriglobus albidus]
MHRYFALPLALSLTAFAADKPSTAKSAQPAAETLDLATIARIREEGISRSHVMEYAAALFDLSGPRLTFSPDYQKAADWSVEQFKHMGLVNAHTESFGETGMGWRQIGTSVLMTQPGTATMLAQADPWSPATKGEITAEVIAVPTLHTPADLDKWKGKLAGKVVLYGDAPKTSPNPPAPIESYDAAKLQHLSEFPLNGDQGETDVLPTDPDYWSKRFTTFKEDLAKFFANEHAVAALIPGGSNGALHDDTSTAGFGWFVFKPEHRQMIPGAVINTESFLRIFRLLEHKVPVSVRINIQTEFTGDKVDGLNVIADLPGDDPAVKDQIVMAGGHLDSWIAGTGATDDGAGVVVAMEALRILKALDLKPRRTIRVALWGGEEQGIYGSRGYVVNHLASVKYPEGEKYKNLPPFVMLPSSVTPKADYANFDAYFNMDNGTGKFLGIFAEGNSEAANIFRQWMEPVKDLGFTTISERATGATDHVSFDQAGLPGFQFIQDPRDYETRTHHTALDTYERLSEPDLRQAATIMAIFLWNAAQRDAMMPRKTVNLSVPKPLEGLYPTAK